MKYKLAEDTRLIYEKPHTSATRNSINIEDHADVLVNILEYRNFWYKVKLFYLDGETEEGWLPHNEKRPIILHDDDSLFDGRFNT